MTTIRQRLGLSQVAFAQLLGIGRMTLINAERGHVPRAEILARMAKAGGVTVDWLLNGSATGGGSKRDRAWQAAVAALRVVWRDPQRRLVAVAVLTALAPAWRRRSRPGSGGAASHEKVPPRTLLVLLALALWTLTAGPARAEQFRGKVISVADGDTISVPHDGRAEPIRLNGIDAPENGQAFSHRAKQFTFQLASGQMVTVRPQGARPL